MKKVQEHNRDVQAAQMSVDIDDSSSSSSSCSDEQHSRGWYTEKKERHRSSSFGEEVSSALGSFNTRDGTTQQSQTQSQTQTDGVVSTENERQILLLMLLAQVCALHDPTPRTFTVHVLELYERGILDRESIGFLFDLGLVPHKNPLSPHNNYLENRGDASPNADERALQLRQPDSNFLRVQEASAIRSRLERQESQASASNNRNKKKKIPPKAYQRANSEPLQTPPSWDVEEHPLSLSRYTREFLQIKLLSSGSFGSVFQATSKMDSKDYAVKRICFSESGYSNESVTQVVREVRCLARCDHPNVVRYQTSWLEPSWVTGSGTAVSSADDVASKQVQRRLLTDIHRMVNGGLDNQNKSIASRNGDDNDDDDGDESCDSRLEDDIFDSYSHISEWSSLGGDDSSTVNGDNQMQTWNKSGKSRRTHQKSQKKPSYRYQMCFFIQMQLCKATTLADWIRDRSCASSGIGDKDHRDAVVEIFVQITKGLAHIHQAGIVHRDLKPANCLVGEDGHFKIGDFGLSKVLRQMNNGGTKATSPISNSTDLVLVPPKAFSCKNTNDWEDPLTMGIGTASYCAPEQVSTDSYGVQADMFSLGLILLEMLCNFGTEHERIHTFHDCRQGQLPPNLQQMYPDVADIIKSCTKPDPRLRPSAHDLLDRPPLQQKRNDHHHYKRQVQSLRRILNEKEAQIQKQQSELDEKDRIIEELRRQMAQISSKDSESSSTPKVLQHNDQSSTAGRPSSDFVQEALPFGIVVAASFSDDDY